MNIHDVMETSWEDLMGVLQQEAPKKEEVTDLADFIATI